MRCSSSNIPGKGIAALALTLIAAGTAGAQIAPTSYDMLNGEAGSFTYYDETYTGSGNPNASLSSLTNGLGDLTNGIVATSNWNNVETVPNGPYVGWVSIDPTITFRFAAPTEFETVRIHFDDSGGFGGVRSPASVVINGNSFNVAPLDPPGTLPFFADFDVSGLNLNTDTLTIQLVRQDASWVFTSEFTFMEAAASVAAPEPGSLALMGFGGIGLGAWVARRRRRVTAPCSPR